ncbi:MAG TPA: glycosyl hydrolase family 18 protein, partial [Cytophagaceae bacterium]
MTKKYRLILTVFLGFFFLNVSAQEIVGYYPSYRGAARALNVPYDQLTKVLYCFINPNTDGTLQKSPGDALFGWDETTFQTVKSLCKSNGVKIYVSIGGADAGYQRAARLYQVCNDPVTRNTFITSILNFANSEGLDGIDIDWEFPRTNPEKEAHRLLLQELRQRINSSSNPNLKLGIAVGGETLGGANHLQYINPQSFSYVDDIHLMAYDFPAGNPNYDPNHHSSYNDALNCINGYINAGAPAEKLVLGVPFYGRSADRNSTADYNQINTGGGNATAYNSDVYNGWYYNGKATLEAKVDLIQSKGGQGIMIWDLGQDRGYNGDPGYELLKVIKDKMDNSCLAPKPNLGPDVGVCGSTPVTLNSNVNTAAGRTFVWKKDGVIISGATSNTYSTTSGGTYVVEVTQNGCTRSDEIKVIAGQSLSVTGATRCGEGQVTLTVNTAGSGFDWYDAELGGSKVHTGSTYSPTLTSTTTFYVQEASSSTNYNAGKAVIDATKAQKEHYFKFGHKTVVKQDLTIVSMRVWTADPTTFRVVAVDAVDGKTIKYSSADISIPGGQAQVVPVNLTLPTGTYYITPDADNRTPTGGNMWTESATTFAGTDIPNVISIEGQAYMNFGNGFNADPSPGTHYGQLFDWVIATGTPPPCGRTPVTATINPGPTQPGNFTASTATVCQGQTGVVYTVPNDPSVIYEWSYSGSGATFASGQGTNSVTVDFASNATNGNISVVAKKVGCGDSPARTIGVTVNPATTASVSISASETTICQGTSVTFTATPVTGGATPSYQWKLNGGNVGTGGSTF